jgi:hypothetical protein
LEVLIFSLHNARTGIDIHDILRPEHGIWKVENDTFLLFEKENLKEPIAKIFELKCFYAKGGYGILTKMNLKAFDPPKVIVYPKFS